jgi:hypothetical protein
MAGPAAGQTATAPRLTLQPLVLPPQGQVLACPAKLATEVLPADVRLPWMPASASVTLIGVTIRQQGQNAILECAYKAEAANYTHVILTTKAPIGACAVGGDQRSFVCAKGTAFTR